MTSRYFSYLPKIYYDNKIVVNITRRVKILNFLHGKPGNYMAYTIKEGEKAEDIAYYYYQDIGKVWLVYLANDIIDPYSQWPMNNETFNQYIISKYKEQSGVSGYNVIRWTQNATITDNIVHYRNKEDTETVISKDTYILNSSLSLIAAEEWEPIRYYDYELELNENKRTIFLVNRVYADQAKQNLERIMKDV